MRTASRLLAAAAVVLTGVVAQPHPAAAAESISSGPWAGSALAGGPTTVEASSYNLGGVFRRSNFDRQVAITVSASPSGSGSCKVAPVEFTPASTPRSFSAPLAIPCNGIYSLVATAVTTDNNAFLQPESVTLSRTVRVVAPAPTVTGVNAAGSGRSVTVTWDNMQPRAADLSGYVVERQIGSGPFDVIATPSASSQSMTDRNLPAEGGTATYRVSSLRSSPDGTLTSPASAGASASFDAVPTTTTTGGSAAGGDGGSGGTDGSGSGGTGSGSSSGGGTTGGAGGTPGRPASGRDRVTAPRVFAGTFLPPLLRPAAETIQTTPTTADPGFDEELPFGDRELGAEDPVLPNDAMASILTDGESGRGLVIPMGTALVLAMWAVHLRLLARAAARAPE